MACAPTGSGKTAAFLVPIMRDLKKPKKKGFRALILCPTRELAKQTQRECLRLTEGIDLRVHTLNKINQAETKYGPASNKMFDILITTPNRVCYLLEQEKQILDLSKYAHFNMFYFKKDLFQIISVMFSFCFQYPMVDSR